MAEFATTPPIPYVPIEDQAALVRSKIDAAQLSAANSFGGLQKLAIPGPFATDAEANTGGVPDDNLYYRSDGTVRAASHISLDLAFALDKTLTARTGPTPTFSRASSGLFTNANGILVGKTAGTTDSITPSAATLGTTQVTVTVASGSVVGWLVGQSVSLIVDTDGGNDNDASELWLVGTIVSTTATQLVFTVTEKTSTAGSQTAWTLGYRGARFDHDETGVCKGLLIEESRTNLVPRSSNFPAGSWAINAARLTWALDATGPDGLLSATTLTTTGIAGGAFIVSSANIASGTTYTQFAILKAGSAGFGAISSYDGVLDYGAMFNLATGVFVGYRTGAGTGTPISNNIESLGNGWWKVSMTYIATGTSSSFAAQILVSETGNLNFATTQSAGKTMIAFAYQLEVGAFPTSYIPTTIGTAARSADVCSIIGDAFSSFYNQVEGTLFGDVTPQTVDQLAVVVGVNTTTFQNSHLLYKINSTALAAGKKWVANTNVAGPVQSSLIPTPTDIAVSRGILSYAYKLNDMAFAANGTLIGTDNTGTMPFPAAMRIGGRDDGLQINGHIARIQYFRKRLSNAKLQTLTAP